jgi:hypothetical protein
MPYRSSYQVGSYEIPGAEVDRWRKLREIPDDAKEQRKQRIFDLWLAGWTNVEIAESVSCDEKHVRDVIGETADLPKLRKDQQSAADHATDFWLCFLLADSQSFVD